MSATTVVGFFFKIRTFMCVFFLTLRKVKMQMSLVKNPDTSTGLSYQVARIVYAQTSGGTSLPSVEAFTSMIKNLSVASGIDIGKLIKDRTYFSVLNPDDKNYSLLTVSADNPAYQMCLRTAQRMLSGGLPDCCFGAVRFHYSDYIPDWARARGYIADIDGILYYR